MSRAAYSVAMTEAVAKVARNHLLRADGQEDVCFALWRPSQGRSRLTALIHRLLLPEDGRAPGSRQREFRAGVLRARHDRGCGRRSADWR